MNSVLNVTQFRAVLTGEEDGLDDLELRISSLNYRRTLTDEGKLKTRISISSPQWNLGLDIAFRMSGYIVIYWIFRYENGAQMEKEMGRAAFNELSYHEGAENRTVNMSASSETDAADVTGTVGISNISYRSILQNGKKQWRTPEVFGEEDLMPGQTVEYMGDTFTLKEIQVNASPSNATVVYLKE